MNVAEFIRSLLARPLVCGIIALLAVAAAFVGYRSSETTEYRTESAVVVIPPGAGNVDAGLNPLINLNNNISQLAVVVATAAQTEAARDAVADVGASTDYTISNIAGDSATFAQLSAQVVIVTTGPDPDTARRGGVALIDYMQAVLRKVQLDAGVPEVNNAYLIASVEPAAGTAVANSPLKAAAAYGAAVVVLGLLALILWQAVVDIRARRRNAR